MPRLPVSLDSATAAIRQHFGLNQQEVAQWLGLSEATVGHLETGRRALSPAAAEALAPLVAQLPAPALALAPPEAAPLAARLDYCQHHARRLRRELRPLEEKAAVAARWAVALPALRAALPPDPGPAHEPADAAAPEWQVWFRHRWLARRPVALPPPLSARYHLLRLQAEALEAEAAALAALLPGGAAN